MATNSKISQLDLVTSLTDNDLLPIVQTDATSNLKTVKTTLGTLKSSVLSGMSSTGIKYTGGQTAIQATASQIDVYDVSGNTLMVLDPTYSQIALHTKKVGSSSTYNSDFDLTEEGLRFTRLETDNTSAAVLRASQLRLNSADGYLNATENVKIVAGGLNNDDVFSGLSNGTGTLYLKAGKKIYIQTTGTMDIEATSNINIETPAKITLGAVNVDITTSEQTKITNTKSGIQLETKGSYVTETDSVTVATDNLITVKSDGIKLITKKDGTVVNQFTFSNSTSTYYTPAVTFRTDSFVVKSYDGNTTLFSNSTISGLSSSVSSLSTSVSTLNSSLSTFKTATSYTVTYAMTSTLPTNTQVGSQLVASANGALTIGGVTATAGQYFFTNLETTSPQYAFNGVCRVDQVGSATLPWKISLYAKPYIVEVSATSSLTGIYVKSTAAGTTNTVYKKM